MTIIYFILILGATVFIHELGHFIMAKKANVYTYEFSIGMGPKVWGFKRKNDETNYSIRLFPIGGFVQMAGEEIEVDEAIPKDRVLTNKKWHQKFLTVIAGVVFNFILALLIFFIVGLINGANDVRPYVTSVEKDSAAYAAGILDNSQIIAINNKNITTIDRFTLEYQVHYGKTITLKVKDKNGSIKEVEITPKKIEENGEVTYQYGFGLASKATPGVWGALKFAFKKFGSLISQMTMIIFYLITGKLALGNLSGPIGIYTIVGSTAKTGIINLIYLTGFLSLNVGFVNIIPFPAFDGGRLFFLIIEKIRGKVMRPEIENRIHNIGFVLLILLMVFVTYNDIIKIFR